LSVAGDDTGLDVALLHRERVHHPGHDSGAGAHVGCWNVDGRSDEIENLRNVAARDALEFPIGHFQRVAGNAALGTAERDVDDGALPGHPRRQRFAVVEVDAGVIADAAFARAARVVVDNAIALKDL
jgi:hypothetical protein